MAQIYLSEFGPKTGKPVLFFHGFPGSHHQVQALKPWADHFHLRLYSPDRPGYGYSEPSGKGLKEFVIALNALLQSRGINEMYLVGVSGGNPAAMTMAAHLGPRALGLASVCGLAPFAEAAETFSPFQSRGLSLARHLPRPLLKVFVNSLLKRHSPAERLDLIVRQLNQKDQEAMDEPGVHASLLKSLELACRQGPAGIVFDLKSFACPWPLEWENITCPTSIWHGGQDHLLSPKMAEFLSQRLPHARVHHYPFEGHYSLPIFQIEAILNDFVGAPDSVVFLRSNPNLS